MNAAVVEKAGTTAREREPAVPHRRSVIAVLLWTALIATAALWGTLIAGDGRRLFLGAPPLFAHLDPSVSAGLAVAVLVGVSAIVFAPPLTRSLSWRRLLWASFALAAAWAVALVFVRQGSSVMGPLEAPQDHLHDLPLVAGPGTLLRGFVDNIAAYTTHVRSHPPGMLLVLWSLARVGAGGSAAAAALVIGAGASAVPAAMIAVRAVAGERSARTAAPFLALAPAALWVATSADALFLGVGAWAVALIVVSIAKPAHSTVAAIAGGVFFGAALMLSYGTVLLALIPAAVALALGSWRALALAGLAAAAVLSGFAVAGFSWPAGLAATRVEYLSSGAFVRPYGYFLVGNLAAFAVVVGPAAAAGLARLHGRAAVLPLAAVTAVLLADLSGMSKGEVERIWLPFFPWVLVAVGAAISVRGRWWLTAQVATAIAVSALFWTPW